MNKAPEAPEAAAPTKDLLKIGDFARLASTNLRTLRYYEELGLLSPALRSEGGFRYYRPTDVNRVRMIRGLQELGLQLDRIGELMARPAADAPAEERVKRFREVLAQQREIIEDRIRSLEGQRDQIDAADKKLDECASCDLVPMANNENCEPCAGTGDPLPTILSALF